VFVLII